MRIGLKQWKEDLKRVEEARLVLEKKNLMLDAIMGTIYPPWDFNKANKKIKQVMNFEPIWVEEPLIPNDYKGYEKLNKKYPIAGGEALNNLLDFKIYKDFDCVDYIQPDVTNVGGYDVLKNIINIYKNKKIAIHVWGSKIAFLANLHFCFANKVEFLEYPMMHLNIDKEISKESLKIKDDFIYPPNEPGLGVHISKKIKLKYKIKNMSNYQL
jgi:L-alanine-DL-glutamate epimerase-like enolase superfamily enzyme